MSIFSKTLPEVTTYLNAIDQSLRSLPEGRGLTRMQRAWLGFCVTAIIVTHTLCWQRFVIASSGGYGARALSFMMRHSSIPWEKILIASSLWVFRQHGIQNGLLVLDDTNRSRSKSTTRIFGVHKTRDTKSGGFIMAQNLVQLVLVTPKITIPVGFKFFQPDPHLKSWGKEDRRLRKLGVKKNQRPKKPERDPRFPSKHNLALQLLRSFKEWASFVKVNGILADAAYLSRYFRVECEHIYPGVQLISQLRSNQMVATKSGRFKSVKEYFAQYPLLSLEFHPRQGASVPVLWGSARVRVKAHNGRSMLVIAVKYNSTDELRYIAATDLTWRSLDVLNAYAYRWLIEVVIEDWKLYQGFGKLAYQQGEEGACRGMSLSLLVDHFLLQSPTTLRLSRAGKPLQTVGSMMRTLQSDLLVAKVVEILESVDPTAALNDFARKLTECVELRASRKHMSGRTFIDFGPAKTLTTKFANTT
jgi:hypothetical protein